MREITNAKKAALSSINWLFSEIASVPFVISSVTNDVIRKTIGIADMVGEGNPNLLLLFVNFILILKFLRKDKKKWDNIFVKLSH